MRLRWIALCVFISAFASALPRSDLEHYEDVQWERFDHAGLFSLRYPYHWRVQPGTSDAEVFNASGETRVPSLRVIVTAQPAEVPLADSAVAAARRLAPGAEPYDERDLELGEVPARAATVDWSMPLGAGLALRTLVISAYHDDRWIVVHATDGITGGDFLPMLEQAALSLRFHETE